MSAQGTTTCNKRMLERFMIPTSSVAIFRGKSQGIPKGNTNLQTLFTDKKKVTQQNCEDARKRTQIFWSATLLART